MNKLFIICGLSFAGKSTLGKAIVERFGYEEVDVDDTKVTLHGSDIEDEDLTQEEWDGIYEETDNQIVKYLNSGKNVVDASRNFRKAERDHIRAIVNKIGHEVVTIYMDTPEPVVRQRWQENRKKPSRRDMTDKDFEAILRVMEPPAADEYPLIFHRNEEVENWISRNIGRLT